MTDFKSIVTYILLYVLLSVISIGFYKKYKKYGDIMPIGDNIQDETHAKTRLPPVLIDRSGYIFEFNKSRAKQKLINASDGKPTRKLVFGEGPRKPNVRSVDSSEKKVLLLTVEGEWNVTVPLQYTKVMPYTQEPSFQSVKPVHIFQEKSLKFIPTLKNPCVFVSSPGSQKQVELQCLPYVILFGTEKCGTSDLYHRLILHQHIHGAAIKESQFWNSLENPGKKSPHDGTVGGYNRLFARGINHIKDNCRSSFSALNKIPENTSASKESLETYPQCPHILLDATPRYFHNFMGVTRDPLNDNLQEPKIIVPHRIHHWLPDARLLLMLRNPRERVLSAYRYFQRLSNQTSNAEHFHQYIMNGTKTLKYCLQITSLKNCIYHFHTQDRLGFLPFFNPAAFSNLCIGIYHVLLKEWFAIFPLENIWIIKLEYYQQNVREVFDKLLKFLNMEPYNDTAQTIFSQWLTTGKIINKSKTEPAKMLPKTRVLLDKFYAPHNSLLYDLLNKYNISWPTGF